ncbi:M1 family metallopeptidase [Streptomyces sp. ASQP_92]|uniref:M1 family metallopeptidase n=1 Tax=Streptomyces sp. ASQP_92 TaxID=2979116 RepID=UPI0021BF2902|nr:M1 family metallopeptidase [Streptomyces sp. ASQP_92]MCT9094006.1 M1 family metallopeptidase [Streptomyces sp. ASQP_92]
MTPTRRILLLVGPMIVLCALLTGTPVAQAADQSASTPDRISYDVTLRADDAGTRWVGRERISFTHTGTGPALREVYVRLWGNGADGCGGPGGPSPVSVSRVTGGVADAPSVNCTALRIRLAHPLAPGARTSVGFDVSLAVPDRMARFGRGGDFRYLGNALPVLAVRDGRGWHLDPDVGFGESYFTLAADFRVVLDHPARLAVPATGTTTTGPGGPGRSVTVSTAHRARDFAWAAGPFRTAVATSPGGVRVRAYWTENTDPSGVASARQESAEAVDSFGKRFGAYPYGELDIVLSPDFTFGSMEYPGFVLVSTGPDGSAVVHEIAHQWWYGIVGDDEYADPWLDESFATYAQELFYGDSAEGCWPDVFWPRPDATITADMGYWARPPGQNGWTAVVYRAGSCALHDLERVLGTPAMEHMLRRYARDHWYGISTDDAFMSAAQAATGKDLTAFWQEHRIRAHDRGTRQPPVPGGRVLLRRDTSRSAQEQGQKALSLVGRRGGAIGPSAR